jgi:hypothetical protein
VAQTRRLGAAGWAGETEPVCINSVFFLQCRYECADMKGHGYEVLS